MSEGEVNGSGPHFEESPFLPGAKRKAEFSRPALKLRRGNALRVVASQPIVEIRAIRVKPLRLGVFRLRAASTRRVAVQIPKERVFIRRPIENSRIEICRPRIRSRVT
jgi:hypothetical protein